MYDDIGQKWLSARGCVLGSSCRPPCFYASLPLLFMVEQLRKRVNTGRWVFSCWTSEAGTGRRKVETAKRQVRFDFEIWEVGVCYSALWSCSFSLVLTCVYCILLNCTCILLISYWHQHIHTAWRTTEYATIALYIYVYLGRPHSQCPALPPVLSAAVNVPTLKRRQ